MKVAFPPAPEPTEAEAETREEAKAQLKRIVAEARTNTPADQLEAFDDFVARGMDSVENRGRMAEAVQSGEQVTFSGRWGFGL